MSRTKVELTDSFPVENDDGERTIIDCYTTFTEFVPVDTGAAQWVPGSKSLKMHNGNDANVLSDSEFEDVMTGRKYRRLTS